MADVKFPTFTHKCDVKVTLAVYSCLVNHDMVTLKKKKNFPILHAWPGQQCDTHCWANLENSKFASMDSDNLTLKPFCM